MDSANRDQTAHTSHLTEMVRDVRIGPELDDNQLNSRAPLLQEYMKAMTDPTCEEYLSSLKENILIKHLPHEMQKATAGSIGMQIQRTNRLVTSDTRKLEDISKGGCISAREENEIIGVSKALADQVVKDHDDGNTHISTPVVLEQCSLHGGDHKKFFCETCMRLVCGSCVILEHGNRGHSCTTRAEAREKFRAEFGSLLVETDSLLGIVQRKVTEVDRSIEKVNLPSERNPQTFLIIKKCILHNFVPVTLQGIRKDVMDVCEEAMRKFTERLQEKRNLLLKRLDSIEKSGIEQLNTSRKEGQMIETRLSRAVEYGKAVQTLGNPEEMSDWIQALQTTVDSIPARDWELRGIDSDIAALDPELVFTQREEESSSIKPCWCHIGHLLRPGKWKLVERRLEKQNALFVLNDDGSTNILRLQSTSNPPYRLAATSNHFVIVHHPATVSIIDAFGKLQHQIHEKDWAFASVCTSHDDTFFVLSSRENDLKSISISRYSVDGRLKERVVEDLKIEALGWLNPRMSAPSSKALVVCAENEIIHFHREVLVLDEDE
ncbi:uncharacterized protein [Diadema antillarum]|uniref:uncharacterized protein n=1 Tax=Diadema antillarum TaxID=105358 RepID=UPI003A84A081